MSYCYFNENFYTWRYKNFFTGAQACHDNFGNENCILSFNAHGGKVQWHFLFGQNVVQNLAKFIVKQALDKRMFITEFCSTLRKVAIIIPLSHATDKLAGMFKENMSSSILTVHVPPEALDLFGWRQFGM